MSASGRYNTQNKTPLNGRRYRIKFWSAVSTFPDPIRDQKTVHSRGADGPQSRASCRVAGQRPGQERRGRADRGAHRGRAVGAGRLRAAGARRAGRPGALQHAVRAPRGGNRRPGAAGARRSQPRATGEPAGSIRNPLIPNLQSVPRRGWHLMCRRLTILRKENFVSSLKTITSAFKVF